MKFINKIFLFLCSFMIFFVFSNVSYCIGAEYYVSPSGYASWNACKNIETPCSTATAMENASAGDVVYFRGGTYNVPAKNFSNTYHGYYAPSNSGTADAHIIFRNYPGEMPVFNGTAGGSGDHEEYATIFGVYRKLYIDFDGFTFQANNGERMGRMVLWGDSESSYNPQAVQDTRYITVSNCIFNGGTVAANVNDNRSGLRVENTDYVTIKNCIFFNYNSEFTTNNVSAVRLYANHYFTIENCEISHCMGGFLDKSGSFRTIVRNNYIHDCQEYGIAAMCNGFRNLDGRVYNNVVSNCGITGMNGISIEAEALSGNYGPNDDWQVYNNTVYSDTDSAATLIQLIYANNDSFYNNILVGNTTSYGKLRLRHMTNMAICDYNCYYGNSFKNSLEWNAYGVLSDWQVVIIDSGLNPDVHSLYSNPMFKNSSGNMNQLDDFRLAVNSPCKGAGKGGVDMGANIDLVGVQGEGGETTVPSPSVKPAPVKGFKLQQQ